MPELPPLFLLGRMGLARQHDGALADHDGGPGAEEPRGSAGLLAEQNARRHPRRSAATATALVVGVAVVSLFTVFAASMKTSLDDDVTAAFSADFAINTGAFGGGRLSPRAADEVRQVPEVSQAVGVGGGPALVHGHTTAVTATDLDHIGEVVTAHPVAGSLADVGADGIAVGHTKASDEGWRIGSRVPMTFSDGATEVVTVRAIYDDNRLLGSAIVADSLWDRHNAQPTERSVFITSRPGTSASRVRQAIEPIARRYGGEVQDRAGYAAAATGGLDTLLGIVYVLLGLAIVIALLGIANTLSLSVHERRREIGLLRAVGQTRRQVRSTLRLESIIVSTFGTALGLVLGCGLGWVLYASVSATARGFTLPAVQLTIVAVLGAAAGALAASRPARRAARAAILDAIATT